MRGAEHGLRYARVPTGKETCGWCLMLASRGFDFTSASAAAAGSHEGCDCVVVPGTAATRVEGYDPEGMAARWGECVSCVDGEWLTRRARAEWEALTEGERAGWRGEVDAATAESLAALGEERLGALGLACAASGEEQAFSRYRARRLLAEALREVERRDPAWAYRGERCGVTKRPGAKPLDKERAVAEVLAENGISVEFLKEVNRTGVKTPDAAFGDGSIWEFKIPEGWNGVCGVHTVRKQFYAAAGKGTSRLLLSNCANAAPVEELISSADEVLASDDYAYITEVLAVDAAARRITRLRR